LGLRLVDSSRFDVLYNGLTVAIMTTQFDDFDLDLTPKFDLIRTRFEDKVNDGMTSAVVENY